MVKTDTLTLISPVFWVTHNGMGEAGPHSATAEGTEQTGRQIPSTPYQASAVAPTDLGETLHSRRNITLLHSTPHPTPPEKRLFCSFIIIYHLFFLLTTPSNIADFSLITLSVSNSEKPNFHNANCSEQRP